jgi:cytochrome d ubiquinol oxidase subunit II
LFGSVYPDVLPSTLDAANSLTVRGAASSSYTLTVMTWLAGFGAPVVLIYQGWTYWVFRRRLGTRHIPKAHTP